MTQEVKEPDEFVVVTTDGLRYPFPEFDHYHTKDGNNFLQIYDKTGEKIAVFVMDQVKCYGWRV